MSDLASGWPNKALERTRNSAPLSFNVGQKKEVKTWRIQ